MVAYRRGVVQDVAWRSNQYISPGRCHGLRNTRERERESEISWFTLKMADKANRGEVAKLYLPSRYPNNNPFFRL